MRVILIGCEYSGVSTLAVALSKWMTDVVGGNIHGGLAFHDHWRIPDSGHVGTAGLPKRDPEADERYLASGTNHIQSYQHYTMYYHLTPTWYSDPHHLITGLHIEDEIYGPKYYGYGEDSAGLMRLLSKYIETLVLKLGPDSMLVLVKASPEVIVQRMRENPHPHQTIPEGDVEYVQGRFEREHERSLIRHKFTLDTSSARVEETVAEFTEKVQPHLSDEDRLRILTRRILLKPLSPPS
jgi:hypothetical protein